MARFSSAKIFLQTLLLVKLPLSCGVNFAVWRKCWHEWLRVLLLDAHFAASLPYKETESSCCTKKGF